MAKILPLFLLLVFNETGHGINDTMKSMPETEYAEFLDTAAVMIEENFRNINTWQGEMNIQEDNYFYGEQCRRLPIEANDPAARSENIRRSVAGSVKFSTDIQNDKLYTYLVPTVKYTCVDSSQELVVREKYSSIISIVTSNEYLSFQPDHIYGYDLGTVRNGKRVGRNAFRLPLEKVKGEQWGHARDPRQYFFVGNRTVWENLYRLRDFIVDPPNDIPAGKAPRLNISMVEMEDHTLFHVKSSFYPSPACTSDDDSIINVTMVLDSSAGLNLIHREVADKTGKVLNTYDVTYEKNNGVYVPKTIQFRVLRPSDEKLTFESQIMFTKSTLNIPIPEGTFEYENLGLKDGDRFTDRIANKTFEYNNGKLIEVAGSN